MQTGTLVRLAMYTALGLTLNLLETYLVPLGLVIPLPGARIGLANLVTVVVLCTETPGFLWAVTFCRIFLASLLTGTFLALPFALSLGGGIAALLVMGGVRRLAPGLQPGGPQYFGGGRPYLRAIARSSPAPPRYGSVRLFAVVASPGYPFRLAQRVFGGEDHKKVTGGV